jgi:hypothetical protein
MQSDHSRSKSLRRENTPVSADQGDKTVVVEERFPNPRKEMMTERCRGMHIHRWAYYTMYGDQPCKKTKRDGGDVVDVWRLSGGLNDNLEHSASVIK